MRAVGGAKEWQALERNHQQNRHLMPFHLLSAVLNHDRDIYSWDCSIFQYQTMCKSSVELGLVYKTFVNKHIWETPLLPGKTNCIHRLRNAGFFGKLNNVIFPSQPKTHFFRDILPELVPCSSAAGWSAPTSVVYVSKSHDRKKLSETCTNPEVRFLPQKYSKWFF